MTVISLNTNLSSLQTQRRLGESTSTLSRSYERLSSGLRVSRAADDAAGLAIASGLGVDSRVFSQGLRNLADGVSVTNIAEGALNELTNIVLRMQELAEQAANGTLGHRQRAALDAEAQALSKEYLRIAKTTEFNGRKLFDGGVQGLSLQAGYGAEGMLESALGGKMGTGRFDAPGAFSTGENPMSLALGDLNADGSLDIVSPNMGDDSISVLLGNGDGTFRAKVDIATGTSPVFVALGDLNRDGILDLVSGNFGSPTASVLLGNGDGTFRAPSDLSAGYSIGVSLGDLNGDGALDIVSTQFTDTNTVSVLLGNGDGTFKPRATFGTASTPYHVALGDLNGDGVLDIVSSNFNAFNELSVLVGNGDGTFKTKVVYNPGVGPEGVALGDLNGDGALDIVCANSAVGSTASSILFGNGDGSFKARVTVGTGISPQSVALGDLNGDGILDIISANEVSDDASILLGNGDGTFNSKADFTVGDGPQFLTLGDLNRDGVLDIVSGASGGGSVRIAQTRDGVSPLLPFSLRTKADAKWALELMKQKLTQLSEQRGIIGANQSRLSTAVATLQVERENYDGARSQITDVDVAHETAALVRTQILQQGASMILSQANQAPALALKLLGG